MRKVLTWAAAAFVAAGVLALLACGLLYSAGTGILGRSYANIPVETVSIPAGADAVARGKHVATIWSCVKCHGADLSGSLMRNDPIAGAYPTLGAIPAPNLTSGQGGIARAYSDADWVRAIRHGVKPDGLGETFMYNYSAMSDRDLGDLIAYLKQLPPVDAEHAGKSYGPLIPFAVAAGFLAPAAGQIDHGAPRPADAAPGATKAYGKYIAAICSACHGTGLVGPIRGRWSREDFARALRTGVLPNGTPVGQAMPPRIYGAMDDTELTALWMYLQDAR